MQYIQYTQLDPLSPNVQWKTNEHQAIIGRGGRVQYVVGSNYPVISLTLLPSLVPSGGTSRAGG